MPADRRDRTRVESQHERLTPARRAWPSLALAATLWLTGCLAGGPEGARPSTGGGFGDITREELDRDTFGNAYLAIQRLRRTWLRRRGAQTAYNLDNRPAVYVDGVRMGFRELEGISDNYVERISLLSPTDATTRFGTNHTAGAIMIVTRRAPLD